MQDCECIPKVLVHQRGYRDEEMEQAPTTPSIPSPKMCTVHVFFCSYSLQIYMGQARLFPRVTTPSLHNIPYHPIQHLAQTLSYASHLLV
jgi:hypothetical protein